MRQNDQDGPVGAVVTLGIFLRSAAFGLPATLLGVLVAALSESLAAGFATTLATSAVVGAALARERGAPVPVAVASVAVALVSASIFFFVGLANAFG